MTWHRTTLATFLADVVGSSHSPMPPVATSYRYEEVSHTLSQAVRTPATPAHHIPVNPYRKNAFMDLPKLSMVTIARAMQRTRRMRFEPPNRRMDKLE